MLFLYNVYILFFKTALYEAVENQNYEIVKLLMSNKSIDVNYIGILIISQFIKSHNNFFSHYSKAFLLLHFI